MGEEETCVAMPENNGYSSKSLDPIPVLRESVSFGRYASESLDWGKWSSFCQNRYLEEAEKYSTRGSVAQKKAHFEAHYKRIAAKKAASLLEQQNAENVSEIDNGRCEKKQFHIPDADFHFTESIDHLTSHDEECVSTEPPNEEVKVEFHLPEAKRNGVTRDACTIKDTTFLSPITSLEDNIQSSPAEGRHISIGNYEINDQHTNERSATERVSKPRELLEIFDNENKDIQVEQKRDSNWKKSPLKDNCTLNQEISVSSDTKRKSIFLNSSFLKRTSKAFPSSPETRMPTSCKKENTPIYTGKTSAKHVKDDKRSTRKNPQIIQSSYQKREKTRPISKPSPPIEKVQNAGSAFSCFKSLDISNSLRTPTKHSASIRSKVVQALTSPEKRRKKDLEGRNSESCKSDVAQLLNPVSGKSAEITYRTSTFCFWSKERAEKRKEFILNLEEKLNAQRLERQANDKEKAENEFKLVRQSLGFKARDDPDLIFTAKNNLMK